MRNLQRGAAHRWSVVFAAAALIAFIGATGLFLSDAMLLPGAHVVRFLLAAFVGPLAFAVSVVLVLYSSERLTAPAAIRTAASAAAACGLAAVSAASWSAGFAEADAGRELSWFGSSTLLFLFLAWVAGTFALYAPLRSVLNEMRGLPVPSLQGVVLAAISALVLGGLLLLAQLIGSLAAVLLLVLVLRSGSTAQPAAAPRPSPAAAPSSSPGRTLAGARRRDAAVGAAALASAAVGLGCAVFALTGGSWTSQVTDGTHAMNVGLAAGALAAIPATVAAGAALAASLGSVMHWSAGLLCAGLVLEAAAQFAGAGAPEQWPLTLAAATLAGIALALPCRRLIPGGQRLGVGVTALLGLGGLVPGLFLVATAGFTAPLAAVALLAWSWRRLFGRNGPAGPRSAPQGA